MEDPSRSPATPMSARMSNYYTILGLPKNASLPDICRAYKSLIIKWNPENFSSNRAEAEAKFRSINEAYNALSKTKTEEANALTGVETPKTPPRSHYKIDIPKTPKKTIRTSFDDEELQISNPVLISTTSNRVTINPSSSPPNSSRSSTPGTTTPTRFSGEFVAGASRNSGNDASRSTGGATRGSTTPTRHSGEFFTGASRNPSGATRGNTTPTRHSGEFFTGASRNPSGATRGSTTPTRHSGEFFTGASRNPDGATRGSKTPTRHSGEFVAGAPRKKDEFFPRHARKMSSGAAEDASNASKRTATPIVYSHSTTTLRRKPPPVIKKLECTLEELLHGCVKKVKITRDAISHFGVIVQEEEWLTIKVRPGWKKGTKLMFEGKGDERPGFLPADIIFAIDEKRHHLYKRAGDDLDLGVEVPLIQALTGCTITVPLLGGESMSLTFDEILHPGCEKIITGQGMPKSKKRRGDLRLKFLVDFPKDLSDEQRSEIVSILEDSS